MNSGYNRLKVNFSLLLTVWRRIVSTVTKPRPGLVPIETGRSPFDPSSGDGPDSAGSGSRNALNCGSRWSKTGRWRFLTQWPLTSRTKSCHQFNLRSCLKKKKQTLFLLQVLFMFCFGPISWFCSCSAVRTQALLNPINQVIFCSNKLFFGAFCWFILILRTPTLYSSRFNWFLLK